MNGPKDNNVDMNSIINTWTQFFAQVWGPMVTELVKQTAGQWTGGFGKPAEETQSGRGGGNKGQEAFAAAMKNWQAIAKAMTTPESVEALLKGSGAMPEILLKLAQTSFSSYLELQQKMIQRLSRLGESGEAYKFEDIDENIFRIWTDIFEKEFRQFLHIPQLGLLRGYQEKANQLTEKFTLFQSNMSEFLRMLTLPFNRSLQVMQENLAKMAEQGSLPSDTKEYYNMWVRILEGHFMTLYQTRDYGDILGRTVKSLAEFAAARDAALEDMIGVLPVAKKSEVDDMARELHALKKRLRILEQKMKVRQ